MFDRAVSDDRRHHSVEDRDMAQNSSNRNQQNAIAPYNASDEMAESAA